MSEMKQPSEGGGYSVVAYVVSRDESGDILGYGSAEIPDSTFQHIESREQVMVLRTLVDKSGAMGDMYGVGIFDHENRQLIVKHSDLPPHDCPENDDPEALGVAPAIMPEDFDDLDEDDTAAAKVIEQTIRDARQRSREQAEADTDDGDEESIGGLKERG